MRKLFTAVKLIKQNRIEFVSSSIQNLGFFFPDKLYLRILFYLKMGHKLNLKKPQTFNEKLQWLKLYDRNPLYTTLVDKYAVKKYVAEIIGEKYVIPVLGVWNKADEIEFEKLPHQFVLKTTNGGGGDVIICKEKKSFDSVFAVKHLNQGLKKKIYKQWREWPYKNVYPRIIAEPLISDGNESLTDYKVMCFDGVPKLIQVHEGRFQNHSQDFYDSDWNHLPIFQETPLSGSIVEKPPFLDEMLDLSRRLSQGMSHVRVDWYYAQNKLLFGEMTFYDGSGFYAFDPPEYDVLLGSWINLPIKK